VSAGLFLITGCSGGGKSTLLAELARQGLDCVPEPGRRIIAAEADPASPRLPWNDPAGFARAALALAEADFAAAAARPGPVVFDRGVLDALVALAHAGGRVPDRARAERFRYAPPVFLAPPWPALFARDAQRHHDLPQAEAEFARLVAALAGLGWPVAILPRVSVTARADLVRRQIAGQAGGRA